MKLRTELIAENENETLSKLFIDDKFYSYVLEDEYREIKKHGDTRIPKGTYVVGLRDSPKFGKDMLWIKDVPGFQFILIHKGNTDADTEGCLLLGEQFVESNGRISLVKSKIAYDVVYPIVVKAIKSGENVTIEINR